MHPDRLADLRRLANEIIAAGADDDETLQDTLAGESNLDEIMTALIRADREAEAWQRAIRAEIDRLDGRMRSAKLRSAGARDAIHKVMDAAGLSKWRGPLGTVSLAQGRAGIAAIDDAVLPARFVAVKREPMRSAILAAMKDGEVVPGVTMGNGAPVLTIR